MHHLITNYLLLTSLLDVQYALHMTGLCIGVFSTRSGQIWRLWPPFQISWRFAPLHGFSLCRYCCHAEVHASWWRDWQAEGVTMCWEHRPPQNTSWSLFYNVHSLKDAESRITSNNTLAESTASCHDSTLRDPEASTNFSDSTFTKTEPEPQNQPSSYSLPSHDSNPSAPILNNVAIESVLHEIESKLSKLSKQQRQKCRRRLLSSEKVSHRKDNQKQAEK